MLGAIFTVGIIIAGGFLLWLNTKAEIHNISVG